MSESVTIRNEVAGIEFSELDGFLQLLENADVLILLNSIVINVFRLSPRRWHDRAGGTFERFEH